MNTKVAFASAITAIGGIIVLLMWSSQHASAAGSSSVEQYKIIYINSSGEDPETTLNKASVDGWKFKATLGDKAVLLSK